MDMALWEQMKHTGNTERTTNQKARWIWYPGDYELYHSMLLHARREEFGCQYPPMWQLFAPYPNVAFETMFDAESDDIIHIVTPAGQKSYVYVDGVRKPTNADIPISRGHHTLRVKILALEAFPAVYLDSLYCKTGEDWQAERMDQKFFPVGCHPAYESPDDDVKVFPFAYEKKAVKRKIPLKDGIVWDFGKEMFGPLILSGCNPQDTVLVTYGESLEEATDPDNALVYEAVTGKTAYHLASRAFRYIGLSGYTKEPKGHAEYEYLPLQDNASFACDNPKIKKIWDTCAYTLHLNSREFYLDGIKRDRWCWSGDAYQSFMANRYLYHDPEIIKRTIAALLGKPPYTLHVNTINDYSAYLLIGAWEYYLAFGDELFIRTYFDRFKALWAFIAGRLDENGYVCRHTGDWIFIDWSEMDKNGPLCAEQILLWRCYLAMADMFDLMGENSDKLRLSAKRLKRQIMKDFWRPQQNVFVDTFASGMEHVTRHAHIFAILYDFVPARMQKTILHTVLENDAITRITTPYFEFFELCAFCKLGQIKKAQDKIESYWGAMLDLGATSIWEQYVPGHQGAEHYAMYGHKYGCSLCHAWGGGPIYLLGRYCLGVSYTGIGGRTFEVAPNPGKYRRISGKVPLPNNGYVTVEMDTHSCRVFATQGGGVLRLGGQQYPISAGTPLEIRRS